MALLGTAVGIGANYLKGSDSSGKSNLTRGLDFSKGKDWWKDSLTGFGILGNGSGSEDNELEDIRSEEQKAAANALQQLAMTGSGAGITLGQGYGGALGAYDTLGQQQALGQLQGLFGGQDIGTARDAFTSAATAKFDPDDPSSGFGAFSRALQKSGAEAESALERESAITGSRFSTAIGGQKADLAENLNLQRSQYLANMFSEQQNRALQGAQGLQGLAGTQANIAQMASQQAAAINAVKDQQARDSLTEFKRQRTEELARIDLLTAESNRNPYVGISSLPGTSAFSGLANSVLGSVGEQAGSSIGSWIGNLFGGNNSSVANTTSATNLTDSSSTLGFDTRAFS